MRPLIAIALLGCGVLMATFAGAQPPGGPDGDRRPRSGPADVSASVTRMMTFDANKDGTLTREEITDTRLLALFERADANHDGVVTKDELTADFKKESANSGHSGPGGGPFGGGPFGGGPGGRGPGGPGGSGMGGPPPIGQVLPPRIQEMLNLSSAQKTKIDALQKHVDQQFAEILTDEQKQQLDEIRSRGPGGFGPPRGGPGGPGGNRGRENGPPGDGGRPQRPPANE